MRLRTHTVGKHHLWVMFLLLLVLAQMNTTKATSGPTVRTEPYASTAEVGERFTLNITLANVQNLYGVEVDLHWNASVLRVLGVEIRLGVESHLDGALHEPIFIGKNETIQEEGRYLLAATSTVPAGPFGGSGNILAITFNVTDVGGCKLDLETKLSDWPPPDREPRISWPIAHNTIDGFFGRQIKISAFPMTVIIHDNISISGSIIPPQGNVEATLLYRLQGETEWHPFATTKTNEQGDYLYIWQPHEDGKYEVMATAIIEGAEETSSSVFVIVKTPEQPVWLYISIIIVVIIIAGITATIMYRKSIKSGKNRKKQLNDTNTTFQDCYPRISTRKFEWSRARVWRQLSISYSQPTRAKVSITRSI